MEEEKQQFNYQSFEEEALKGLLEGKRLEGKDGVLAPLIKRLLEAGLQGEMNQHLSEDPLPNRRNGKAGKQVKTAFGKVVIEPPKWQF